MGRAVIAIAAAVVALFIVPTAWAALIRNEIEDDRSAVYSPAEDLTYPGVTETGSFAHTRWFEAKAGSRQVQDWYAGQLQRLGWSRGQPAQKCVLCPVATWQKGDLGFELYIESDPLGLAPAGPLRFHTTATKSEAH